jgi:hypothetical protein
MHRVQIAATTLASAVLAACAWGSFSTHPEPPRDADAPSSAAPRDTRARAQQEAWKRRFAGKPYRYLEDPAHRLVYATCLDETSHAEMQRMIAAQADQQAATLFGAVPDVEVFVAIATPADAKAVIGGNQTTEGMYEHPLRRLVASDIGMVLRHEFTHAMHFGHMERLGQPHMLWVQEGLASLYETYDLAEDGSIVFQPNLRHNQARLMARNRTHTPLATLVALKPDAFMAKSQQLYPQVRSLFEFLADTGKLRRWYARYTETFEQDRTGARALEEVLAMPLSRIEEAWRTWVLARPAVETAPKAGERSIGVEVDGATDGVRVRSVERRGAAARAGIRVGDVVTAVDGAAVRSAREFAAALAAAAADRATVTLRRGAERLEVSIEFSAANPRSRAGVPNSVAPWDGGRPDIPGQFLLAGLSHTEGKGP